MNITVFLSNDYVITQSWRYKCKVLQSKGYDSEIRGRCHLLGNILHLSLPFEDQELNKIFLTVWCFQLMTDNNWGFTSCCVHVLLTNQVGRRKRPGIFHDNQLTWAP